VKIQVNETVPVRDHVKRDFSEEKTQRSEARNLVELISQEVHDLLIDVKKYQIFDKEINPITPQEEYSCKCTSSDLQ